MSCSCPAATQVSTIKYPIVRLDIQDSKQQDSWIGVLQQNCYACLAYFQLSRSRSSKFNSNSRFRVANSTVIQDSAVANPTEIQDSTVANSTEIQDSTVANSTVIQDSAITNPT
ncbi:hypothetical protein CDAR_431111 [Caerostris darwini]|uniref:Uncharacterized protein n=1 Tax=Caerostris darwini TaxID=1538125 RepID=A0AAV4SDB0_9ARAC|nr:hypothetical protein CDAR_431111 [Caerostris darwini]